MSMATNTPNMSTVCCQGSLPYGIFLHLDLQKHKEGEQAPSATGKCCCFDARGYSTVLSRTLVLLTYVSNSNGTRRFNWLS